MAVCRGATVWHNTQVRIAKYQSLPPYNRAEKNMIETRISVAYAGF